MESDVPTSDDPQRPAYSPLVRRLAEEFDVDLEAIRGTGPGGRVTRADVQQAAFGPNLDHDQPTPMPIRTEPAEPPTRAETTEPAETAETHQDTEVRSNPGPGGIESSERTVSGLAPEAAPAQRAAADARVDAEPKPTLEPEPISEPEPTEPEPATEPTSITEPITEPKPITEPEAMTSGPAAPGSFSLFAEVDAAQLLRAQLRLSEDRHQPMHLAALTVRLLVPALVGTPEVNARQADGYQPADTVDIAVVLAAEERTVGIDDACSATLSDLAQRLADGPEHTQAPATLAVECLTDTVVNAAVPALWADTAATIAIGHPRQELRLVDGAPRPVPVITIGLTCSQAVDPMVAHRFLSDLTANLEDPILVFAD